MKEYQFLLTYSSVTTELSINPAGWDNIGITFIRNSFYHSVLRNLSLSLRFARVQGGGADIIMQAFEDNDISAVVSVTINKRNPKTNSYTLFYKGDLSFLPGDFSIERDFVQANIIDGIKLQKFISRDTINFDVFSKISADNIEIADFTHPSKSITLTPIDIYQNVKAVGTVGVEGAQNYLGDFPEPRDGLYAYMKNMVYNVNEIGDRVSFPGNTDVVWENTTDRNLDLYVHFNGDFNIKINCGETASLDEETEVEITFSARIYDASNNVLEEYIIMAGHVKQLSDSITTSNHQWTNHGPIEPGHVNVSYSDSDVNFWNGHNGGFGAYVKRAYLMLYADYNCYLTHVNIPPNGYLSIMTKYSIGDIGFTYWQQSGVANISVTEISQGKENTTAKTILPYEAFSRLIQLTTSEQNNSKLFYSEILGRTDSEFLNYPSDGSVSKYAITSGRLIRNYPNDPLALNVRDLFHTFDVMFNLGFGYDRINDRFYIEKKEKFYDSSYFMFSLGEVKEFKITPLPEAYFNKINSGYVYEREYDDFQGAYEFNLQREYSVSVPIKEEFDNRIKYNADSVGIELARRSQYIDNASKDTRYDKLIYIIDTNGATPIVDDSLEGFLGLKQYYNTSISPRRNLVRWGNIIKSALFKNSNPVKFQSAAKVCEMMYYGTDEFSSIEQNELPDEGLFIPQLYTFKSIITPDILLILNQNPHGFIRFTFRGGNYEGFINKITTGDYNKSADYELIAKKIKTPDNFIFEDNTNFITESNENLTFES